MSRSFFYISRHGIGPRNSSENYGEDKIIYIGNIIDWKHRIEILNKICKSERKFRNKLLGLETYFFTWLGWIPGILGFSTPGNEIWIWIAQILALEKSFKMIQNSNHFCRSTTFKIHFLTFVWAFEWVDIIRHAFQIDKKMRKKIPHLLTQISWTPLNAEKRYMIWTKLSVLKLSRTRSKILVEATIWIFDHFEQGSCGTGHVGSSVGEDPMFSDFWTISSILLTHHPTLYWLTIRTSRFRLLV